MFVSLRRRVASALSASCVVLASTVILAAPVAAETRLGCNLAPSDATALEVLNAFSPNKYVWDDAHLTVAVHAAPTVARVQVAAIRDAIQGWRDLLAQCFRGAITLTDVTGTIRAQRADIAVHYVPHAGGLSFGGMAICGVGRCPNVLVRSEFSPGQPADDYPPYYTYYKTLHELGHALGLGHATNLFESSDLMGYGWSRTALPDPLFSRCDVAALAYIWSWALDGATSAPPSSKRGLDPIFDCSPI